MSAPKVPQQKILACSLAIAACSFNLTSGSDFQLMPAGPFKGIDGRPAVNEQGEPTGIPTWQVKPGTEAELVAAINSRIDDYVIDYDHQTLRARQNGKPAPAAGWFKKVEWRGADGLWAVDVQWTPGARQMIEAGEYRYISPVFAFDKAGNVTGLLMAAITNYAAIDGMAEVAIAAASLQFNAITPTTQPESTNMEELLEKLRWMLNLPITATADEILAELNKLSDQIKGAQGGTAAATCDLVALFTSLNQQVAAASATPDPAKFVPIEALTATRDQVAALSAQVADLNQQLGTNSLDSTIQAALLAGKILPAQEQWARDLGRKDIAALSAYLEAAPAVAALGGMQTQRTAPPVGGGVTRLSESQVALCSALGVPEEQYLKTLQSEKSV